MMEYRGIGVTQRIAIGRVFLVDRMEERWRSSTGNEKNLPSPAAGVAGRVFSPEGEKAKLVTALEKSRKQIQEILRKTQEKGPANETTGIIATQLDYFDDPAFNGDTIALIERQGLSAIEAVTRTVEELRDTFNSFDDDP
jgi:phosphoenolpyruvate-protein kinase (PTS system EI component)